MTGDRLANPPIFERTGETTWRPRPEARGPFEGVQGGALAGLMCAAAESHMEAEFRPVASTTVFLRPGPMTELVIAIDVLRQGRRNASVEVILSARGEPLARSLLTFVAPRSIEAVPDVRHARLYPDELPLKVRPSPHGEPWLMQTMERREASDGVTWFRSLRRLTGEESSFAAALATADWSVGLGRPDSWETPMVRAFPNVDLTVHMARTPAGPWVGVCADADWRRAGHGVASARLYDQAGSIGRAQASVVLVPLEP